MAFFGAAHFFYSLAVLDYIYIYATLSHSDQRNCLGYISYAAPLARLVWARGLCLIQLWGLTNAHVINMNYLELAMKTTQMNSVLLSSLSYVLKNVGLRLRIVL